LGNSTFALQSLKNSDNQCHRSAIWCVSHISKLLLYWSRNWVQKHAQYTYWTV